MFSTQNQPLKDVVSFSSIFGCQNVQRAWQRWQSNIVLQVGNGPWQSGPQGANFEGMWETQEGKSHGDLSKIPEGRWGQEIMR